MIKSKLSGQLFIPIILFILFMLVNFFFLWSFLFDEQFFFKEPFLNLGTFMIMLLVSMSIIYDLTYNLTMFKLKEDTFEIRTIFRKDEIPYRAIYYLYEEEDVFRLNRNQILTIQTKKSTFRLRSFYDSNYDEVKVKLTEKATQYVNLLA